MTNPFEKHREPETFAPGGMRTYTGRSKVGDEKDVQISRTSRPYAEDLADAYNKSMNRAAKDRGHEWFVAPNGELMLGDKVEWSRDNAKRLAGRAETERARYIRHQLENSQ